MKSDHYSPKTMFAEEITDIEVLRSLLVELVEEAARRLCRHDIMGHTIELKGRFADFQAITCAIALAKPTSITHELLEASRNC